MTDVIVIDKLTKSFKGKTVLEDVNMQLQEGGIYGIVGDNGSGKTVLLKLICGFMKPDSGTVTVNGSPASNRIANYNVYEDDKIDILDITEAQRFYRVSSSDTDNWSAAQKADVNADGQVDIQDLIDIFLQIKF